MRKISIRNSGIKPTILIGLLTLFTFGIGGYILIEYAHGKSFPTLFSEGKPFFFQFAIGAAAGLLSAGLALIIITRRFFTHQKNFYFKMISQWKLTFAEMIFLSLCAGTAEELFFRAGLQPFLGIWWTALLFVSLHGYLNPKNWRISVYGIVMTGVIAGFGYMYEYFGIYSAMAAHSVFDLILFLYISKHNTGFIEQ